MFASNKDEEMWDSQPMRISIWFQPGFPHFMEFGELEILQVDAWLHVNANTLIILDHLGSIDQHLH